MGKKIKVKNVTIPAQTRQKFANSLSSDASKELKAAMDALMNDLETSDVEIDESAFAEQVIELAKTYLADPNSEVPAAVANAIALKIKAVQDSIAKTNGAEKLPEKVKNSIVKAILTGKANKESIKDSVDKILVENSVTGLTFNETIDFAITTKWEDLNPLFTKLHKTFISKFFYSTDEMNAAAVIAKRWDKNSVTEKAIQALTTTPKTITTEYAYARQKMNQSDLDEIIEAGQESVFLNWINTELDMHLVNTIIMAVLVGDTINEAGKRITTFETIGTKTVTDAFTIVSGPAVALQPTVTDVRKMCDKVYNPMGKDKILVIDQSTLTNLSAYKYAAGGDTYYKSLEEMAGQFGVNSIYVTDVLKNLDGLHAVCLIPDGYWYKEKKYISLSWPTYEFNQLNFMKERNIGGKVHDLLSTAILVEGGAILNDAEPAN